MTAPLEMGRRRVLVRFNRSTRFGDLVLQPVTLAILRLGEAMHG
jgi:hypothetical protein